MADEPKKEPMLRTTIEAEFIYPDGATTPEELAHRKLLQTITDKAVVRLQPIFRAMTIEILEAQSAHYVNQEPEEKG